MNPADPYQLPADIPAGSCFLGPPGWPAPGAGTRPAPDFASLRAALAPAGPGPQDKGETVQCVWLHGGYLLGAAQAADLLAAEIAALLRDHPGLFTVLVSEPPCASACALLYENGLGALLAAPVQAQSWERVLSRLAARRLAAAQRLELRRQSEETARRLQAHRRALQEQLARVGEELIGAQQRLEAANRSLTHHVSQLSLLYKFGRELSQASNWDEALHGLLGSLSDFLGAGGAALVLRAGSGMPCRARQTYRGEDAAWERVLLRLEDHLRQAAAQRLSADVMQFQSEALPSRGRARSVTALPLEHQGVSLGFLLLLDLPAAREAGAAEAGRLPFLQAVQVILAEEVAGAQMLDRLRELSSFNAQVLETVRSGIWVLDEQGRTIYCNRQGRSLLTGRDHARAAEARRGAGLPGRGRRRESGAVSPLRDGSEEDGTAELLLDARLQLPELPGNPLARLRDPGREGPPLEGRIVQDDGEAVPVLVQASLMAGGLPGEQWLVLVAEDLREAKKLEAERSRADGLASMVEMSAALAHEIRNPLTGLSAQAELLAAHLPAGDARRRYLDVITAEVERINGTISRLLQFVRPYEPVLAEAHLPQLARTCLDLTAPRAAAQRVELRLALAPQDEADPGWRLRIDGAQIKQVVLNLLLNALDAAPPDSTVTVALRREARLEVADPRRGSSRLTAGAVIEVRDSGAGFPPGEAERIFRPFYTTKSAGTGLGLSICRKIAAAHGGQLLARRRDGLTIFQLVLPAAAAAAPRQQEDLAR